jgi:hypothetical protein
MGDCNDYAVTKRHELLENGLPSRALRLSVVKTASGIGHLVLVVVTTKGDIVMDDLTEVIRPWQGTDYHWLKIQSATDSKFWYEIKGSAVGPSVSQANRALGGSIVVLLKPPKPGTNRVQLRSSPRFRLAMKILVSKSALKAISRISRRRSVSLLENSAMNRIARLLPARSPRIRTHGRTYHHVPGELPRYASESIRQGFDAIQPRLHAAGPLRNF